MKSSGKKASKAFFLLLIGLRSGPTDVVIWQIEKKIKLKIPGFYSLQS